MLPLFLLSIGRNKVLTTYIYILRCSDNSLYTGWTNDVEKRVAQHNAGKGAKYTRSRLPATLVYRESCSSEAQARRREYKVKQLSHEEKLRLVTKGDL